MFCTKMGVINLTPNSSSDGNPKLDSFVVEEKINEQKLWADIIDFGAESTAPFNKPISAEEEKTRFERFLFPYLASNEKPKFKISLDTYRLETFSFVYAEIKKYWPEAEIIWNDVSGKWDDETKKFLKDYSEKYVFCHNLAPERSLSSSHMDYLVEAIGDDFIEHLNVFFEQAKGHQDRVILDPCFGFSKTREQNLYLLKHIEKFFNSYSEFQFLYGISRKSFLRYKEGMNAKKPQDQELLDAIQAQLIAETISKKFFKQIYFRVHSPIALESIEACQILLGSP